MSDAEPRAALREARSLAVRLLDERPPLLVVTDFDGTMAPITLDPQGPVMEPIGRRALRRLAALAERVPDRLAVAVLSGRLAADVAGHVRVGGIRYLGNHGLEGGALARRRRAAGLAVRPVAGLGQWVAPVRRLTDDVVDRLGRPGWLFVERKGPTVAFHFRQAPDPDDARVRLLAAIDAAESAVGGTGLARVDGRMIVELRPETAGGKGRAMERLLARERPGAVLVLGDDVTDAEAFDVVRATRDRGDLAALAVAVHAGPATPPAVAAAADVELGSTRDAARLLAALATALEREAPRPA